MTSTTSSQSFRLAGGGRIDRARPVRFTFNGRSLDAFVGDTVASALLANGIALAGRSFKYHRPRGILSHGSDEPNVLLDVDRGHGRRDPNNRATVVEVVDGLAVRSQNHWPSLEWDLGAINDRLAPLFPAGFYYKTFKWPASFWHRLYEPAIRAMAGLGVAPHQPDPDRYDQRYAHCEVLVAGSGPAGLAAALAASEQGARVILADEQAQIGGTLLHDNTSHIDGATADAWRKEALATLSSRAGVTILPRTTVFGYYNHNQLAMVERLTDHLLTAPKDIPRERLWQVRAKHVILATGAHERPVPFPDNDRPGIILAESVRAYINRYAVTPGRRIIFVAATASAYRAAADAKSAGLDVQLVDIREPQHHGAEVEELRGLGVEVLTEQTVLGSTGRSRTTGLIVAPMSQSGTSGTPRTLPCDAVAMSGGWTPAVHLFSQSRGRLHYRSDIDAFVPKLSAQAETSVGSTNGTYDLAAVVAEGWLAGSTAIGSATSRAFSVEPPTRTDTAPPRSLIGKMSPSRGRAFIDFQNDVTVKDIQLAVREGFQSIEHVKRYTTTGMATDQGKTSNMLALGIVAETLNKSVPEVGTTTFRPPFTPVSFGAIVGQARGELFDPIRKAPLHDWAVRQGAVFEPVGLWQRARYFPKPGENMRRAVARECRAVRSGVGILDASTLGKIEVVGPDAAEFLNRIYINAWLKLAPGRCRYGIMLREDGFIFDDGVVARIADDRFHVTTTTGGADRVLMHMEDYLQTEWPDLKVYLTSITEQWGVIALQGPKARQVIESLVEGIDLSPAAFPHMAMRTGKICGFPTRLFRVSFSGELGFEINVPTRDMTEVWEILMEQGEPLGITPYGTEAMHVLRAERGFIIVGHDTDGTVTPDDAGLGSMVSTAKRDFVGKRSLARPDMQRSDRLQLVGLLSNDPALVLDEGAQIIASPKAPIPMSSLGHVTSSYWSETCGRSIALALLAGGRSRLGETLHVTTPDGFAPVKVSAPVFFDQEGRRVNGEPEHA